MKAVILAVGSEMLTPFRVDTNSLFITERLNTIGYDVRLKAVVGDDVAELARLVADALAWADLIVFTGGLGPTEDDITRDAVARALDVPLDLDECADARVVADLTAVEVHEAVEDDVPPQLHVRRDAKGIGRIGPWVHGSLHCRCCRRRS